MLTFRMDETNFDQGARDGLRLAEGLGLKVDFDELAPDADTLGLWHLHDGGCAGEGTGLADASGGGHDFANHGADAVEAGYRFDRADGDRMDADYAGRPQQGQVTLECWVRDWALPADDTLGAVAYYWLDSDNFLEIIARRGADPASSRIQARLMVGGTTVGSARWTDAEADALLAGPDPWHVAAVLDVPNHLALYVGGTLRAEAGGGTALPAGDYTLYLGGWPTGWDAYDLSAVVDEVRLSSAARYSATFTPHRLKPSGTFTSPTFDAARLTADWTDLAAAATVPDGCSLAWEVRAADETDVGGDPQALWLAWAGDPALLPDSRYFQWRITLSADGDRLASPTVASVEATASEAGYDLFLAAGTGPDAIDYTAPWRQVGPGALEVETDVLAGGAVHWFGVRPVDADGRQNPLTQDEARLELDEGGVAVPDRPAAPLALHVEPLPAGAVRLQWRYRVGACGVAPQVFRIFGDGGTGTIDYEVPLGDVACDAGRTWHTWTSGALAPGVVHHLAVRAVAAGEVWDEAPAVVEARPDAEAPGLVDTLSAEILS